MTRKRLRGSAEMSIPLRNAPRRRGMSKEAAADGRWQMASTPTTRTTVPLRSQAVSTRSREVLHDRVSFIRTG